MPTTFVHGMTAMGCLMASVYFIRFWWESVDRFFLLFGVAFVILAIDYGALGAVPMMTGWRLNVSGIRMLGFACLLAALAVKLRTS